MKIGSKAVRVAAGLALSMTAVIGFSGTAQANHMAPTLRYGSSGYAVECVQILLNRAGLGHSIKVDGQYGRDTKGMVEDFQRARGRLDIDGVVGRQTGGALWELTYSQPRWYTDCFDYIPTP
ncbi:peptidoglycan-binding protein [Streptomyces sp. NBC_00536]|uniref:peptidoglycan-binding domain-containing protein n=1 Tax=Streptomyces sp. NBC_00536 TaxID=2975769 RepID=UPI002E82411E|nr:peptidoglycan-binding domain-containing protein [Streptomyces sp. NBC_00536]WUC78716.1 peptidoglycan-binding protein [Streptomyces sp. NBC_00536]